MLGKGGRIITCGATTGANVNLKLNHLFYKNQSIIGSTMSNMNAYNKVQGQIRDNIYLPFVGKIFPLNKIVDAHKYFEQRKHLGKVVIKF